MPMPTLQQIIGTITGKVAFERTQENFTTIRTHHNNLETAFTSHEADNVSQGNPHGIDAKANKVQGNWITATLQNGWGGTLRYRKNEIGQLELQGRISQGTKSWGTAICQLPTGYRPIMHSPINVYNISGEVINGITLLQNGNLSTYHPFPNSTNTEDLAINQVVNL